jgi:signal transduction histidine kinase
MQPLPAEGQVYMTRAAEGLRRLDTILTRMLEATRLEQLVREQARERFDAREVIRGCATGYSAAYPRRRFELSLPEAPVMVKGSPDLYAQLLDKLVANAADFATGEEPIRLRIEAREGEAALTVSNRGPTLPNEMEGRLFESMVSVRPDKGGNDPHLGLGLYIVRLIAEFHGGRARALNREDGSGVVVRVECPVAA